MRSRKLNEHEAPLNVIDALTAAAVPYMLVGSYSSNFYGIPRSTADADFVIALGEANISDVVQHLHPDLRLDPQTSFETVTGTIKNVLNLASAEFTIELFRLSEDAHDQERFTRRVVRHLFERDVYLPTAEDVIVTKLRWFRGKDRDDIASVLAVQGDGLDFDYIHRWCEEHGTRTLLDEIRHALPPLDGLD